nr:MAG TPA: hypothetical protein [Caudoviricetes sp.]
MGTATGSSYIPIISLVLNWLYCMDYNQTSLLSTLVQIIHLDQIRQYNH